MITRCPECATAFHISQEQLEARVGQVRCGRCGEIFDASATLEVNDDPDARLQPASAEEEGTAGVPEPELAAEAPIDHSVAETTGTVSDPASTAADAPAATREDTTILAGEEPVTAIAEETIGEPVEEKPVAPTATAEPVAAFAPRQADMPGVSPMWAPQAQTASATPYASRAGSHASPFAGGRVRRRPATGWWLFLSLLLLLILLAQALFHYRGTLALLLPESKPYIYTLCAELGCDVPLPRRADLMSIETSDLQADADHPGVLLLSATLRNRAAFPQDFPALELTLTNERDQPLARRVLQPRDYLRRSPDEGFQASSEQQVRLHLEAAELKASGYRLYLFYP